MRTLAGGVPSVSTQTVHHALTVPDPSGARQHSDDARVLMHTRRLEWELRSALRSLLAETGDYPEPRMQYSNALREDGTSTLRAFSHRLVVLALPLADRGVTHAQFRTSIVEAFDAFFVGLAPVKAPALCDAITAETAEQGLADVAVRAAELRPDDIGAIECAKEKVARHWYSIGALHDRLAAMGCAIRQRSVAS